MNRQIFTCCLLTIALTGIGTARAQQSERDDQADMTLTPTLRQEVIDGIVKALNDKYVFPDVAKKMEAAVRERVEKKEYDEITSAKEFVKRLTEHLQAVSNDKHLRVKYSHEGFPAMNLRPMSPAERDKRRADAASRNFGFEKVERLDGNVGYLDLRAFISPETSGDTAAAAMNFLANADSLIIDLRKNGGGSPASVALLCTYLFPAEPVVHLNDLYFRPDDLTHQWWTLPYVPGKRFIDKPVYVLTSKHTFSAAEECTYNLKNQKRATIVGEKTGGGAHPGGMLRIKENFVVFVPSGRAINPITKTNWEGAGVQPDIEVSADLALKTAHVDALKNIAEKKKGDAAASRDLERTIESVQKELDALKAKPNKSIADTVE